MFKLIKNEIQVGVDQNIDTTTKYVHYPFWIGYCMKTNSNVQWS